MESAAVRRDLPADSTNDKLLRNRHASGWFNGAVSRCRKGHFDSGRKASVLSLLSGLEMMNHFAKSSESSSLARANMPATALLNYSRRWLVPPRSRSCQFTAFALLLFEFWSLLFSRLNQYLTLFRLSGELAKIISYQSIPFRGALFSSKSIKMQTI